MARSIGDYIEMPRTLWRAVRYGLYGLMPKGLYVRALAILLVPIIILQLFVLSFFIERYLNVVTVRLARAMSQDIAMIVDLHKSLQEPDADAILIQTARSRFGFEIEFSREGDLPMALPKPFFLSTDPALSGELRRQIGRPFWLDTVGRSNLIEIRIKLDDGILRIIARRSSANAFNILVFTAWIAIITLVLMGIAVIFLRNQIRPILRLADAAENFGLGRDSDFSPHGAREVRQAGYAFIAMKRRIERTLEQRITMLNGVSHDLRTILTRLKLSLALMDEQPEVEDMRKDVVEMQNMLEGYLAFARGETQETSVLTDLSLLLNDLKADIARHNHLVELELIGDLTVKVRPEAVRRCLTNLTTNAMRHGHLIVLRAFRDQRFVFIHVDDDGGGIAPHQREEVFRPFYRLDEARNQDQSGSGLGLSIARDIARAHGGEILLSDSPLGGLRASVRLPV